MTYSTGGEQIIFDSLSARPIIWISLGALRRHSIVAVFLSSHVLDLSNKPYIVHPMEVGNIVSAMTEDEEIISAAILHDTIEDCEGVTQRVLAQEFSERVANMAI